MGTSRVKDDQPLGDELAVLQSSAQRWRKVSVCARVALTCTIQRYRRVFLPVLRRAAVDVHGAGALAGGVSPGKGQVRRRPAEKVPLPRTHMRRRVQLALHKRKCYTGRRRASSGASATMAVEEAIYRLP